MKRNKILLHCTVLLVLVACDKSDRKVESQTPKCDSSQVIQNGKCVTLKFDSVKPLFVPQDEITTFTVEGQHFTPELEVQIENCTNGKMIKGSSNIIEYKCKPTTTGEHSLVITNGKQVVFWQQISVSNAKAVDRNILPPKPSNPNQTLSGVDTNKNGVRDEVERELVNYVATQNDYDRALISAKAYQEIIDRPTPKNREQALKMMSDLLCRLPKRVSLISSYKNVYHSVIFDTKERKEKYMSMMWALEGGYSSFELSPCK